MEFTQNGYRKLLQMLKEHAYQFRSFTETVYTNKCVVMRHDIDFSLQKACELSWIEAEESASSTWMVLLNTDFYNAFSEQSRRQMKILQDNGGTIGLHFDESQYHGMLEPLRKNNRQKYEAELCRIIREEAGILAQIIQAPVNSVAFHCPTQEAIELNLQIPEIINAYSRRFFKEFKYLSDSSMYWREDVESIVREEHYRNLQILTHAFWYPIEYMSMRKHFIELCKGAACERYENLDKNYNRLSEILRKEDIC